MATWDAVDVDFGGDETGNFGPRLDSGVALYQVDTSAVISPKGQVDKNPHVCSAAIEDRVCVSAGKHLSFFDNSGHKFLITLEFESDINVLAWTEDGNFVAAGEQNGCLHFIDGNTQKVFFSKALVDPATITDTRSYQSVSFTPVNESGVCSLMLVTTLGKIFQFRNIQVIDMAEALETGDVTRLKDLEKQIAFSAIDVSTSHDSSTCALPYGDRDCLLISGNGGNVLSCWQDRADEPTVIAEIASKLLSGIGVQKCKGIHDGNHLLVLDEAGKLSIWSTHTFTILRRFDMPVADFMIMETDNVNNKNELKVVLLTKPEKGTSYLHICTLPRLKPTYSLQLGTFTRLTCCLPSQEVIYLIEGNCADAESDLISSLRVRMLSESQPDTRLHRILHKKRFDEAETFAKQFNLDVELVYKVKSHHLLDCLGPWKVDKLTVEEVTSYMSQLQECLENIKDDEHIVQCCTEATPPTFEATHQLLNYARNRLNDSMAQLNGHANETICRSSLLTKVYERLHRLATFEVAFGVDNFRGSQWDQFTKANMLYEFLNWLANGRLDVAFTIWKRHRSDFDNELDTESIADILHNVPEQALSEEIKPWLAEDFIPFVIKMQPQSLGKLASWLEQRARNMELTEKRGWPANSLELCQLLKNSCLAVSQSTTERVLATPREFATQACNLLKSEDVEANEDPFVRLQKLIIRLKDLLSLHTKYNCRLSLAEYCEESTESLTYRMLDHVVAVELIPSTIEKIVRPYMQEHGLEEDKMLFQYIDNLAQRCGSVVSVYGEAPWEAKAIAVIGCISDPDYKCRAILDAMRRAHIPWSEDMKALVNHGLSLKHPRTQELSEECRRMELKKMLIDYDLKYYNVAETNEAETLVNYILSQDRKTCVEDAFEVVKAYNHLNAMHVYFFRTIFLVERDRITEMLELLKSLSVAQTVECGKRLIIYATEMIAFVVEYDIQESRLMKRLFAHAACEVSKFLLTVMEFGDEMDEIETNLHDLENIYGLQVEYGEYLTLRQYRNTQFREELLNRHLENFFFNSDKTTTLQGVTEDPDRKPSRCKGWNHTKLFRLAELLQTSRDTLRGQLAIGAAQIGKFKLAIDMARELCECDLSPAVADFLFQVAQILCKAQMDPDSSDLVDFPDLPATIHDFAKKALIRCSKDRLSDCLELCKTSSLAENVARQCESGDYGITVKKPVRGNDLSNRDPYKEWTFDDLYIEEGLVMDSSMCLPKAYEYAQACLPLIEHKDKRYRFERDQTQGQDRKFIEKVTSTAVELTQYLQENGQTELALQYSLDALSSVIQHVTAQDMGVPLERSQELQDILTSDQTRVKQVSVVAQNTINTIIDILLRKLVEKSRLDHSLALGCVLCLQKSTARETLKKLQTAAGHHYKRVRSLAKVGVDYAELSKEPKLLLICKEVERNADWGHKFNKLKISFKSVFNSSPQDKKSLIPQLVQSDAVTVELIKEYCSDFSLANDDEALFMHLDHLLLPHDMNDDAGDTNAMQSLRIEDVLMKAELVFSGVEGSSDVEKLQKLDDILHKLDPYDYDRLIFVLNKMEKISPDVKTQTGLKLLEYLLNYKRIAEPSEYERDYQPMSEEKELLCGNRRLSEASKQRLPFHPLFAGDQWKIISPELNSETVSAWLKVVALLNLSADNVYLITIQNIVRNYIKARKPAGQAEHTDYKGQFNWDSSALLTMFDTVKHLLLQVSVFDVAVMCASWTAKELPMGAERVLAFKTCVYLAEKWMERSAEGSPEKQKAQNSYTKFSNLYKRLSTEQTLHQHRLGSDLVSLANRPVKLIFKLYEHDSIQQRGQHGSMLDHLPDIHKVADEIGQINQVDLSKIRLKLLEQWLPSSLQNKQDDVDTTINMDTTSNLDMTVRNEEDRNTDEINLNRAIYLLQHGSRETNAMFLLNYAYNKDSTKTTNMCRVRALQCLFVLVDNKTIAHICQTSVEAVRNHMQILIYMVELERLRIPQTLAGFDKCNKEGLVRSIWKNHRHQQRAVRLIADICLDYHITDVQLWNSVLQQLMAFQQFEYLRHVMIQLSGVPDLWQVECIQNIWRSVLLMPLTSAVPPLSDTQLTACLQSASLLHRCPLLLDMDMKTFAKHFVHLELPTCALSCLLLIPQMSIKEKHVNSLLSSKCHISILDQLAEFRSQGRSVPLADQISGTVFLHIDEHNLYGMIEETDHKSEFAEYLVKVGKIRNVISFAIKHNRLQSCTQLLWMYQKSHPSSDFTLEVEAEQLNSNQKLILFLQKENLLTEVEEYLPAEFRQMDDTLSSTDEASVFE